jgi:hypothetical protein
MRGGGLSPACFRKFSKAGAEVPWAISSSAVATALVEMRSGTAEFRSRPSRKPLLRGGARHNWPRAPVSSPEQPSCVLSSMPDT